LFCAIFESWVEVRAVVDAVVDETVDGWFEGVDIGGGGWRGRGRERVVDDRRERRETGWIVITGVTATCLCECWYDKREK
jgi:hypothetical protein